MSSPSDVRTSTIPASDPITLDPANGPITRIPAGDPATRDPATRDPASGPITRDPASGPATLNPASDPITRDPASGSITLDPVGGPITRNPASGPITRNPASDPATLNPAGGPATLNPANDPANGPITRIPSLDPSTAVPPAHLPAFAESSPTVLPILAESGPIQIAIDGPAGSGKSTIARELGARLGITYLDTGAMYRAFALKALRRGLDTLDPGQLATLCADTDLDVRATPTGTRVFLDGEDVTNHIRTAEVGRAVPRIAAVGEIRAHLVDIQRRIAAGVSVVMDGRDIGTAVLPRATFKFYLTADVETRAQRRLAESLERGENVTLESLIQDIRRRDEIDSTRAASPLRMADDAVAIDTTHLTIEEVVEVIMGVIARRAAGGAGKRKSVESSPHHAPSSASQSPSSPSPHHAHASAETPSDPPRYMQATAETLAQASTETPSDPSPHHAPSSASQTPPDPSGHGEA